MSTIIYESSEKLSTEWIKENAVSHDFADGKGKIVLKDSVTKIEAAAFHDRHCLTFIFIPKSITEIGAMAFTRCSNLKSVVFSDSVTEIGAFTFASCGNLSSVIFPDSVKKIGESAFMECSGLTAVYIPDSVKKIGEKAFFKCGLWSISVSESTEIGEEAFDYCERLPKIRPAKAEKN